MFGCYLGTDLGTSDCRCEIKITCFSEVQAQLGRSGGGSGQKWRAEHDRVRTQNGLSDFRRFSADHVLLGVPLSAERVRDAIDVCWQWHQHDNDEFKEVVMDTSQSLSRKPFTNQFRSMTKGSNFFVFGESRLVLAREHLSILGFPKGYRSSFLKDTALRGMAGESMAAPSCTAVLLSLLAVVQGGGIFELPRD
eukprot:4199186-Amphidinium_carterae.1